MNKNIRNRVWHWKAPMGEYNGLDILIVGLRLLHWRIVLDL